MTYAINGVTLTLQPTEHYWLPRGMLGTTGDGHPVYAAVREYMLRWNIGSQSEFQQFIGMYNDISYTGNAVVRLPEWNNPAYTFHNYSGCTLTEPEMGSYFTEHPTTIAMIVRNIRTQ